MLIRLTIQDFAVVRLAELEFGEGFTVISGETGAGKSLIVDALQLLSGQRAESSVVRHGALRADLLAEFQLTDDPSAGTWLDQQELDEGERCQLRRVIRADGRSRAWINGRPVTLTQLAALAGHLLHIHGQHDHYALLDRSHQRQMLDRFADHTEQVQAVHNSYQAWQDLHTQRDALRQLTTSDDHIALLTYQLGELDEQDLSPQTLATLDRQCRQLAKTHTLLAQSGTVIDTLGSDHQPSVVGLLQQVQHQIVRLNSDAPALAEASELLDAAAIQIQEAAQRIEGFIAEIDCDPNTLATYEKRLDHALQLARKHRCALDELAMRRTQIHEQLHALQDLDQRVLALEQRLAQAQCDWSKQAAILTQSRQVAAQTLGQQISAWMQQLGMKQGEFSVRLSANTHDLPNAHGAEQVEFLITTNPGQPPRQLPKVASGGELARISLAMEVATSGISMVPTLVFDEVDSGISGAVADLVGRQLRTLGAHRQVFCVTHLPQIAAKGDTHYRVSKAPIDGITQSAVERLNASARQEELAKMLGGVQVSAEARAAARRLLDTSH